MLDGKSGIEQHQILKLEEIKENRRGGGGGGGREGNDKINPTSAFNKV